jgi:hypothetical protein
MTSDNANRLGAAAQAVKDKQPAAPYYPEATWQCKTPPEAGINPLLLKQAIDFAISGETKAPRDLVRNHYQTFGREPFGDAIGPIKERGEPTGLIIRHGYIVAEWGEPARVDMTHSVTKSLLSSVVGVAVDRSMISSINDTVRDYVAPVQVYTPLAIGNKSDRLIGKAGCGASLIGPIGPPTTRRNGRRGIATSRARHGSTMTSAPMCWHLRPSMSGGVRCRRC